jgi:hypothetical protein
VFVGKKGCCHGDESDASVRSTVCRVRGIGEVTLYSTQCVYLWRSGASCIYGKRLQAAKQQAVVTQLRDTRIHCTVY